MTPQSTYDELTKLSSSFKEGLAKLKGKEAKFSDAYSLDGFDSSNGFAFHRVITDEKGMHQDFTFIDVNEAYESLTGHSKDELVGRNFTSLPDISIRDAKFDWVNVMGHISQFGARIMFYYYCQSTQKWITVSAFSPLKGYFITFLGDITTKMNAEIIKNRNRNKNTAPQPE
jgi:PAS domain-containing protein